MATAFDVAVWFSMAIDRDSGDSITHLKIQKLVYYAQAWSLAMFNRPIFEEELQAWAHGPVSESVFHALKEFGWDALPPLGAERPRFDDDTESLLADILNSYGDLSAKQLERLTHEEDPWKMARGDLPPEARSSAIIPKAHMAEFYSNMLKNLDGEKS